MKIKMTKLTEAEFLKLPPRQQDAFIAEKVFGNVFRVTDYDHYVEANKSKIGEFDNFCAFEEIDFNKEYFGRHYTTSWNTMRLGVEKANEEGIDVHIRAAPINQLQFRVILETTYLVECLQECENLAGVPLAFWIAYLRALGIIEE